MNNDWVTWLLWEMIEWRKGIRADKGGRIFSAPSRVCCSLFFCIPFEHRDAHGSSIGPNTNGLGVKLGCPSRGKLSRLWILFDSHYLDLKLYIREHMTNLFNCIVLVADFSFLGCGQSWCRERWDDVDWKRHLDSLLAVTIAILWWHLQDFDPIHRRNEC